MSFGALGNEGIFALTGAAIAGGGAGYATYKSSGYDEGGGGPRSSGIINAGSSASLAPIGTVYYPLPEGVNREDIGVNDLPGPGGLAGKVTKSSWLSRLFKGWKTAKLLGPSTQFGIKISKQLSKRGWTKDLVVDAINNPARTVKWKDTRYLPGGNKLNDSATAFYSKEGGYVVRNNRTGDIVQISDRLDNNWLAPWDQ